jgi:hypothetical protein
MHCHFHYLNMKLINSTKKKNSKQDLSSLIILFMMFIYYYSNEIYEITLFPLIS